MHSKNKCCIIIIAYNEPDLIIKQIELTKRFCKDNHDLIIVDNSEKKEAIEAIKYHADLNNIMYMKTHAASVNGSSSHSFAANLAYEKFMDSYQYFFYLDHDCFPVKPFSIVKTLNGKSMAGIGQQKSKLYYWPGCLMFVRSTRGIDFSPLPGLDTGGSLYRFMEECGKDDLIFFNEAHIQNKHFEKSTYNFYALINDGMFMHFINGSNWNEKEQHKERLNSLFNILTELCASQ